MNAPQRSWPSGWEHIFESTHAVDKPYIFSEESAERRFAGDRPAQRFELQAGDVGAKDRDRRDGIPRERAERRQQPPLQSEGDERWYAWSMRVPADFPEAPAANGRRTWPQITLAQFQQEKGSLDDWHPSFMFAKMNGGPLLVRRFQTWHKAAAWSWPLLDDGEFRDEWHDILVHARWSVDDGFFRVWVNGKQRVGYDGPTRIEGAGAVYHKYGIYRVADSANLPAVAYFSQLRMGETREEVEQSR
jgi:hypothetical protein